jgi:hypothetical protein
MILPSDSDLPSDRNEGKGSGNPGETPWWEDPDLSAEDDDESGDGDGTGSGGEAEPPFGDEDDDPEIPPNLTSMAGPGWRRELGKEILESLRDLEAIEDPDDEFAPPEPPDLFTFFGELAALRNELRHQGQRSHHTLSQLDKTLAPLLRKAGAPDQPGTSPSASGPSGDWPAEHRLALVSLWDLLPQATAVTAFEAAIQPLLAAAGLVRIPAVGQTFDPATMTRAETVPATKKLPAGQVVREIQTGFLCHGHLLRPARVAVSV